MDDDRERLREGYAAAGWPTLSKLQAGAINALMEVGEQAGGPGSISPIRGHADPPPAALMLVATHGRTESPYMGEPPADEIAAIAEDGRAWTIARAGIAWPAASNPIEPMAGASPRTDQTKEDR